MKDLIEFLIELIKNAFLLAIFFGVFFLSCNGIWDGYTGFTNKDLWIAGRGGFQVLFSLALIPLWKSYS